MKISIYSAIAALLTLTSCVQESPEVAGFPEKGNRIFFRSYLPSVDQTRGAAMSNDNLTECRVSCINPYDPELIETGSNKIRPYFSDIRFFKNAEGRFVAQESDSCFWPSTTGNLHFFAYYPSVESMRQAQETGTGSFKLVNNSIMEEDIPVIDYRLTNFTVAPDIADQVDFIAACSEGTQQSNGDSGMVLDFHHQMARIDLLAWSGNIRYNLEIAGVRIGNALTEGEFNFSSIASSPAGTGEWLNTKQSIIQHIFTEGESIVYLSKTGGSHDSQEAATSITGTAGGAMVIPMTERIEAWEGLDDPDIGMEGYRTDKLYISVLIRVRNMADEVVYPYPDDQYNIPAVYLSVGNDGKVIRRVYKIDGEYYTSDVNSEEFKYEPGDSEEIRGFCWAALPVAAKWEAGKIYTYRLNYTNGIGWHDPEDPHPGEPIINDRVIVNVEVSDWKDGGSTDMTVPRK
ncbi:MAG: fimbrillin family protein [Muribaculaceae bacterium]|nr:fimbrillin family protein [Muribaculaceae bacterium]